MIEIDGAGIDIWDEFWNGDDVWRVVESRGYVDADHRACLGPGSEEAVERFPNLRAEVGKSFWDKPYKSVALPKERILVLPIKGFLLDSEPNVDMILRSCTLANEILPADVTAVMRPIAYLEGELYWDMLRDAVGELLDDRFTVLL